MQLYPIPLTRGKDSVILDGVGEYIAKKLDEKLENYLRLHAHGLPLLWCANLADDNLYKLAMTPPKTKKTTRRRPEKIDDKENEHNGLNEATTTAKVVPSFFVLPYTLATQEKNSSN